MDTTIVRRYVLLLTIAFLLCSCMGRRDDDPRWFNFRALESSLERPVTGPPAERTYWNPAYKDREFFSVRIKTPRLQAPGKDDVDYQRYLVDMDESLKIGMRQALAESKKFRHVSTEYAVTGAPAAAPPPDLLCRVDALAHVALLGQSIQVDPALRDPRSKILVITTLEDPANGEVVFKYTHWEYSQWENAGWAMKDLPGKAFEVAKALRDALKEW